MLIREVPLLFTGLEFLKELLLESAAARGRCRREGVGSVRHLSTHVLCLQQLVNRGGVTVGVCVNPQEKRTDLDTKSLFVHTFRQLMQWNGLVLDRHENSVIRRTQRGWTRRE